MQTPLAIGSVHIDIFADASSEFSLPCVNDLPGSFVISVGGTIFNVASTLKYLGMNPFILTSTKRNSLFTYIIKYKLKELDLNHYFISDNTLNESAFLALRQNGDLFAAITASAWDNLPQPLLEKSLKLLFSENKFDFFIVDCNLSSNHIETVLKFLKNYKLPVYVCATSSYKIKRLSSINLKLLTKITAIFLNTFEFESLEKNIVEELMKNGTLFFITEGEKGVRVLTERKTVKFPTISFASSKSFSGAGDAFAAGVIYSLQKKSSLEKAIIFGLNCVSAKIYSRTANILDLKIENIHEAFGIDRLTLCYTRNLFEEEKESLLKEYSHILLADIDHFKKINDTYGHDYGDHVLKEVAKIIKKCIRSTDKVYRFGGEEFLILLSNTTNEQARMIAERIREEISTNTPVTITIGVSECGNNIDLAVKKADILLYQGKTSGRNKVVSSAPGSK